MQDVFIYDAIRTPRGKGREGGALHNIAPVQLLDVLFTAVRERNRLDVAAVNDVVLGCVTQVGDQGGNIAKVAALYSGFPQSVSGITVNRYCTSGLDACNFAAMKIMTGMDDLVLAGGVESMSRVPLLSDKAAFYTDPFRWDLPQISSPVSTESADRNATSTLSNRSGALNTLRIRVISIVRSYPCPTVSGQLIATNAFAPTLQPRNSVRSIHCSSS